MKFISCYIFYFWPVVISDLLDSASFCFYIRAKWVIQVNLSHWHLFRRRVWHSKASWTVWRPKSWSTEQNSTTCRSWIMTPSSLKKQPRWSAALSVIDLKHACSGSLTPHCHPHYWSVKWVTFYALLQAELQHQEDLLYKERKERERIIASYRKKVEERKAQAEKVGRRVRSTW